MIFLLRCLLWKRAVPQTTLCALLQDAFVAAQIALLPKSGALFFLLFLYQWVGILMAARLKMRLTPSLLPLLKYASQFADSAKAGGFIPWLLLGAGSFWLIPQTWPEPLIAVGLLGGLIGAYWSRRLGSAEELAASNPLFDLQWGWWVHPAREKKGSLPSFTFEHEEALFLSKERPLLRNTFAFSGPSAFAVQKTAKPNILFLFLESFRAKNIGALGARLGASPHFDALAKEGVLFTQCMATGPFTFYAAVSSLCGAQPSLNTFTLQSYQETSFASLPHILSQQGYKTAWFDGGYATFGGKRPFSKRCGVGEIFGAEEMGQEDFSWGVHDEKVFDFALRWLKQQSGPLFGSLFTLTNHHPWETPSDWRFAPPKPVGPVYRNFLNAFSYTDAMLGKFVEQLRREGLLDNTILFITGDHGQEMDDSCETYILRTDLSQQNLHVPLLIYGNVRPQIIDTPCSHADLMPTVLDWLGLQGPHHCVGRSLLRDMARPAYFSLPASIPRWGCRAGSFKWTGLANGKEGALFDLEKDPEEKVNLADVLPEKSEELKSSTLAYFDGIETLFEKDAWAPPSNPVEETWRASSEGEIRFDKPFSIIDLSAAAKMTDSTILSIGKTNGPFLRYLTFPNSPCVTDRALFAIADHCPHLIGFSAHDSPLLTSQGVAAILEKCPRLKLLSLDGSDEIVDFAPRSSLSLSSLHLGEGIPISENSWLNLIQKSPLLTSLKANIGAVSAPCLALSSQYLTHLDQLCLFGAEALTEELLQTLLRKNPHLSWLKITDCPLSSIDLTNRPKFKWVEFHNCPHLKEVRGETEGRRYVNCPWLKAPS